MLVMPFPQKERKPARRLGLLQLRFRKLSNDAPLGGSEVVTTCQRLLEALSALFCSLILENPEVLHRQHLCLSTGKYKQPYNTTSKKMAETVLAIRRVGQGYVRSTVGRTQIVGPLRHPSCI
jgi:hypothetical protein